MAKKAAAGCKCIEAVNAKLASVGAKVVQHMRLNFSTGKGDMSGPCVEIRRYDKSKRGKIPIVPCTYCPFCGKRQPD